MISQSVSWVINGCGSSIKCRWPWIGSITIMNHPDSGSSQQLSHDMSIHINHLISEKKKKKNINPAKHLHMLWFVLSIYLSIFIYLSIYLCVYIYIYVYVHIHIYLHTYIHYITILSIIISLYIKFHMMIKYIYIYIYYTYIYICIIPIYIYVLYIYI